MVTFRALSKTFFGLAALAAAALTLYAQAPKGWFLAGTKAPLYVTGVDESTMYSGMPSAYLRSKESHVPPEGFGTLMQQFSAKDYLGKRVRFGAFVKSENLERMAGLWMRVDGANPKIPLAFDNMHDRPIQGTSGWKEYEVVLDVPPTATGIAFGILLDGGGAAWISAAMFTEVGANVPTTAMPIPGAPLPGPTNLGFAK
jgi:hypothetical protein